MIFEIGLILNKLIHIYFNLNRNLTLIKNLILIQENYWVKDNLELLKNVKVNMIHYAMQSNLSNRIREQWI